MSSATPAAFWSAMSMTTTSASDLSATPRATVAPTLPAPPTTVTLRFIKSRLLANTSVDLLDPYTSCPWCPCGRSTLESSHVPDNGIPELGRLQLGGPGHLPREV